MRKNELIGIVVATLLLVPMFSLFQGRDEIIQASSLFQSVVPTPTWTRTPTPTPVAPTPTNTPALPTPTNTPALPTPTNTPALPTPTNTPEPLTPTPTETPVLSPPTADAGGPYLVAVDSTIPLDGSGADPDGGTLSFQWSSNESGGTFSDDEVEDPDYTAGGVAGIFELTLEVTDPENLSAADTAMLVVYDSAGGFVTGGGWIDSPAGAYVADPTLTGKATFGFVSKYKKGASAPAGNTEFQFKAGDLNFYSDSYQWLVVNQNGSNAQFKGNGTINGKGDYKFQIWAGDDDPDTFRIRIWWEKEEDGTEHDVYDNGVEQAIGGGSIVVHTGKK